MFALGANGTERLWEGSTMEPGIHLRWGFRDSLGFPLGGFDLYRRPHQEGDPICIGFTDPPGTSYPSGWQPQSDKDLTITSDHRLLIGLANGYKGLNTQGNEWLRIAFHQLACYAEIIIVSASHLNVTAYHGPIAVAEARTMATGGPEEINLTAAAIDAVQIEGGQGLVIQVCRVPVSQISTGRWEQLNVNGPIVLPVTMTPDYPIAHEYSPDDQAEAARRVPFEVWEQLATDGWSDLHEQIESLVKEDPPVPMAARVHSEKGDGDPPSLPGESKPEIAFSPMQQVMAATLNHNIARILGLYWIDDTAGDGQIYDYMIVGHWIRAGRSPCPTATYVDFRSARDGVISEHLMVHEELIFFCSTGLTVVTLDDVGAPALIAGYLAEFASGELMIFFQSPVLEVCLHVRASGGGAEITAFDPNHNQVQQVTISDDASVTLQANEISRVHVIGFKPHIFSICYLRPEDAPGDRAWILQNVRSAPAPPLSAPLGLRADVLPGMVTLQDDGTTAEGCNTVGLRWDVPVKQGVLEPEKPVMYQVRNARLGTDEEAEPADPDSFTLRDGGPVVVAPPMLWKIVDHGATSPPSHWELVNGNLHQSSGIQGGGMTADDLDKPGTCALAGRLEWSDYKLKVNLESETGGAIGVVFRYQNKNNFYRFSMNQEHRYQRLVKCVDGKFTGLWEGGGFVELGRIYRVCVLVRGDQIKAWIDDQLIFDVTDGDLRHGMVGLYCWANPGAVFHRMTVTPPTADKPYLLFDDFSASSIARLPDGWPDHPLHILEHNLPDGWYGYQVASIDLFGRLGPYSPPLVIRAQDQTPPPSPVIVRSRILQSKPEGMPESVMDKTLTNREREWLAAHPAGGLNVEWIWSGQMRLRAPDAAEFRVYFAPGQGNTIAGWITGVSPAGAKLSKLTTDRTTSLPPDVFKGRRVRVGVNEFKVVRSTSGPNFTLTVENIENPERATDETALEWMVPIKAGFALTLGTGHPQHIDYRQVQNWETRLHVEPVGALPTAKGTITVKAIEEDGACTLTTDQTLLDLPSGTYPQGRTVPGVLISSGEVFQAIHHTSGPNFQVSVSPVPGETGDLFPGVNDGFVYYPGYRYGVILNGMPLSPTSTDPVIHGLVGVSCADDKTYAMDSYPGGGRIGNEGAVSPPLTVSAVHREKPKPLDSPPDSESVYAAPADYYGLSHYTLRWTPSPDQTLKYQIYRALGDSIFAMDKKIWSGRPFSRPQFISNARWPAVVQELNTLSRQNPNYDKLSNDALQVLASLPGNADAFTALTPEPQDPDALENSTGGMLAFTDALNGRAQNRYFYRIAMVDRAGNRSELADSSPPIYLPDTMPPRSPLTGKVLGGERKVTLTWQANHEPAMKQYLVYRTTDRREAEEVRMMGPPVAIVPHPAAAQQVTYEDKGLPGPMTYYYRLMAVREGRNGPGAADVRELNSPPTTIIAARNYDLTSPVPPEWTRAEWVLLDEGGKEHPWGTQPPRGKTYTPAVALKWTSTEPYVRWIVQRGLEGGNGNIWLTISPWLQGAEKDSVFLDTSAFPNLSYVYRIIGVDIADRANKDFREKALPAPE
jgi:hypothetical protein